MANINEVARKSGVSVGTVSKVFNNYKGISQATRDRVFKVAEELNYTPSKSAIELVTKRKVSIGLILSKIGEETIKDEFLIGILSGVYKKASSENFDVVLFTTNAISKQNKNYVQFCNYHNLVGAIIQGLPQDSAKLEDLLQSEVPVVLLDVQAHGKMCSSISVNNYQASREVMEYLVKQGHRHIALLNGSDEAYVSIDRKVAYLDTLNEYKLPINEDYIRVCNFVEDEAYQATIDILKANPEISAIFACSDFMAVGAIKAAHDLGLKVPEDLAVFGFDDIFVSSYFTPSISSVKQNFFKMGEKACQRLIDIVNTNEGQPHEFIEHELIIRESTEPKGEL